MIQISDTAAKLISEQLGHKIGDTLDYDHEFAYCNLALGFHFIWIGKTEEGHKILKEGRGFDLYPEWEPQIKAVMGGRHAYWRTMLLAMYLDAIKKQHISPRSLAWVEMVDPLLVVGFKYVNAKVVPSVCAALRFHFELEQEAGQAVPYDGTGPVVQHHTL